MVVISETYSKLVNYLFILCQVVCIVSPNGVEGALKRCFQCRSRGELGSCKDTFNGTLTENVAGIQAVPCASGWCGKVLEGGANQFKDEEYGIATERLCLQRGPPDNEERCAPTTWGSSKVQMCLCTGDLCNGSKTSTEASLFYSLSTVLVVFAASIVYRI